MKKLSIDFETRSDVDITATGAYKYAQCYSTGVYCMAYAFDDEPIKLWVPGDDEPFPEEVKDYIRKGGIIQAWNAQFERLIFWYVVCPDYDVPEPAINQFECTAARARAHGLPGSLGDCAKAMGIPQQKQAEGQRLIRTYSVENIDWSAIPETDRDLWLDYCEQDVEVERMIAKCLRELTPHEQLEYQINESICDRGVPIDVPFVAAALEYAEDVKADVDERILKTTGGKVKNARARKDRDEWLLPRLTEDQKKLLTKDDKIVFDKRHRESLAAADDLKPEVSEFIKLVEEAGGATISKYEAMLNREIDGRLNGALMFNGAGQTGRYSSLGIQLHNLRRDGFDDPDPIINDVIDGYEIDDVTETLARLIRSSVYLPGGLSWVDYSAIEGRVAPWLEDGELGEAKLQLYRDGVDPYKYNASKTFGCNIDDVTKDQRQAGKLQELALQFLGGVGALKSMAANFGLTIPDNEASMLRDKWREANPWAMKIGRAMNKAAIAAVKNPLIEFDAGRVAYAYDGKDWLWCKLPSGRLLAYFQPRLELQTAPWGEEYIAVTCLQGSKRPKAGQPWPRRAMHAGLWLENNTQAAAADLLRNAIVECVKRELCIVLHVHDEIVIEGSHVKELTAAMLDAPAWAEGLPLSAEGDNGTRYGK